MYTYIFQFADSFLLCSGIIIAFSEFFHCPKQPVNRICKIVKHKSIKKDQDHSDQKEYKPYKIMKIMAFQYQTVHGIYNHHIPSCVTNLLTLYQPLLTIRLFYSIIFAGQCRLYGLFFI